MKRYIVARLIHQLVTLAGVLLVVFVVTHLIGDPVRLMLPDAPADVVDAVRTQYGLDQPMHVQLASFVRGLLELDFGVSIRQGAPNLDLILARLPATFQLALAGTVLAAAIGLPLGVIAALRPGSLVDRGVLC